MQKLSGMAAQLLGSDADAPAETAAPPRGTDAARIQLLHALRPFLSENTRAQTFIFSPSALSAPNFCASAAQGDPCRERGRLQG